MKEALLYQKLEDGKVQCRLCSHRCVIKPGEAGICKVRENHEGLLLTRVYGRTVAEHVDPIEKKPLYHFYPGSKAYSIAAPGCNFHCRFCQNWEISQEVGGDMLEGGRESTPGAIVLRARKAGCESIAYTYTEPTVFFEYTYDIARESRQAGIKNIYVSNGYMTHEMLDMIGPFLDAINVDLKAFRDETYRRIIGARLQPVLDNLKKIKTMGIWLEVTSLIIPGINDDVAEIRDMADFVASELGADVPWHISRFFPAFRMQDAPPTPLSTLRRAKEAGRRSGLRYIYVGNIRTSGDMDTVCPACGLTLIRRSNGWPTNHAIRNGHCPRCGTKIAGVGLF